MAANSIAKLSVVITGDSSPLRQSFNEATANVNQFAAANNRAGVFISRLGVSIGSATGALGPFRRTIGTLAGLGGSFGIVSGGIIGIGVAAVAATGKLAAMADEARDSATEIRRAYADAFKELNGTLPAGFQRGVTGKEATEGLKASLADFGRLSGLTITPFKEALNDSIRSFNKSIFGEQAVANLDRERKSLEDMKTKTEQMREAAKKARDDAAAAQRAEEQRMERLRSQAERLAESLRTPQDILKDSLIQFRGLAEAGLISLDTYGRAVGKARKDFADSFKAAGIATGGGGVGAAERFTTQGFSAIQAAIRGKAEQDAIAKQQLEQEKKIELAVKAVETAVKASPKVAIRAGRL